MTKFVHFSHAELACPRTRAVVLAPGFGEALDALRDSYGLAMPLTSACRSAEHNARIGGHPRSLHLIANAHWRCDTCAVDVAMADGPSRGRLIELAWDRGWSVGIAPGFLHLDRRTAVLGLAQTTWVY